MEGQQLPDYSDIDTVALARELRNELKGEVRFDDGSRVLYATDSSNHRQVPLGVVLPRDDHDVVAAMEVCRRFGSPVLPRGSGTSLSGQCCNVAVVIDYSKYMNRILEIDPQRRIARVQPGVVLAHLRSAAEKLHLTFAPDPALHTHTTIGGLIGNNSCGFHSMMGGRTADNILELELLTYDGARMRVGDTSPSELERIIAEGGRRGEIYGSLKKLRNSFATIIRARTPDISRSVSGFNLDELLPERNFHVARSLVGSEGSCVAILEATVRLVPSPPERAVLVLGYADIYGAGEHVSELMAWGPVGLEAVDDGFVADMIALRNYRRDRAGLPEGQGWLIAEFGGNTREEAIEQARRAMDALQACGSPPSIRLYTEPAANHLRHVRDTALGPSSGFRSERFSRGGWEDSAVPKERLGEYLRELRKLLDIHGYSCDLFGHFGQGCVHTRINFDPFSAEGKTNFKRFIIDAADLVVRMGGSLSSDLVDGETRGELLERLFGPDLVSAFKEFKGIWDPEWKMNPGSVVEPWKIEQKLRPRANSTPHPWKTVFQFPDDQGDFARATQRCVGIGKCRSDENGTMCPSYMVLREEKHCTRGRARLISEMLHGDLLKRTEHEDEVRESLDLCLSCKGCRGECPTNVNIPAYKAEFLHHYYKSRRRPRHAYLFGYIDLWLRLGSSAPSLINAICCNSAMGRVMKGAIGIPQERHIPTLAPVTFQKRFGRRTELTGDRPSVILWPDTFNNHFMPDTALAAVDVLESAGFRVRVPRTALCCGRPLYEYGLLDRARRLLVRTLKVLENPIREGVPMVVLEPACASVFKDELAELFPHNGQAARLKTQTYLLSEFLQEWAPRFSPPTLHRKALVHLHCHHRATMKSSPDHALFQAMGLDFEILDSGCCGMAGSFGFEKEKYDLSIAVGNRVLLPRVREADKETLIVSDGYSCREQIRQCTGRRAVHIAELLSMALKDAPTH